MTEFFEMGGYAAYIWPCYILAAVVLTGLFVHSLRTMRQSERDLDALKAAGGNGRSRRTGAEEAAS